MGKTLRPAGAGFQPILRVTKMADDQLQKSIVDKLISWAAGQPFNNVLLLLILGGGAWLVAEKVPDHLNMIQSGYREVIKSADDRHREERAEMMKNHREERERDQQFYNKLMDKVSNDSADFSSSKVANKFDE
jgi:hypothetical protein